MKSLPEKILIAGGIGGTNVGDSFFRAAGKLGIQAEIIDTRLSNAAPAWQRRISWHLFGRRPVHLNGFSQNVLQHCIERHPEVLVTTGLAPVTRKVLIEIARLGIKRINFLTDDPWNKAHRAEWFMKALPHYDEVYSPRRAMLADLKNVGCKKVEYLPFAYDQDLFYPVAAAQCSAAGFNGTDIVFAGGADDDRVSYMQALNQSGLDLALYGEYWNRRPETRDLARGQADIETLRMALSSAKVGLCLVRRANRDGSCMRTFEVPAVGTCMLTEDTQEHRDIFGEEVEAVLYFDSMDSMLEKAKLLCEDEVLRNRLAENAHKLITQGGHTYKDRLFCMLAGKSWGEDITS